MVEAHSATSRFPYHWQGQQVIFHAVLLSRSLADCASGSFLPTPRYCMTRSASSRLAFASWKTRWQTPMAFTPQSDTLYYQMTCCRSNAHSKESLIRKLQRPQKLLHRNQRTLMPLAHCMTSWFVSDEYVIDERYSTDLSLRLAGPISSDVPRMHGYVSSVLSRVLSI